MSKPVFSDLFAFHGRRNRKSYFLYAVAITVLFLVLLGIAAAVGGVTSNGDMAGPSIIVDIILGIVFLLIVISAWIVGAQRCRDFGWTGWAILLSLIPFVGGIFAIAILFVPGTQGPNRFGPDPLTSAV